MKKKKRSSIDVPPPNEDDEKPQQNDLLHHLSGKHSSNLESITQRLRTVQWSGHMHILMNKRHIHDYI
jgi:hypothetical protein